MPRHDAVVTRPLFPVLLAAWFLFSGAFPAHARVVITEVFYDPPGSHDAGREWIEVLNDGSFALDMASIYLVEQGVRHPIFPVLGSGLLASGGVAVIAQDSDLFLDAYPDYVGDLFLSEFSLRQEGDVGELLGLYSSEGGQTEFEIAYDPDERSGGTGGSLHIVRDGSQVAAPATPGLIAVNPITVTNARPPVRQDSAFDGSPAALAGHVGSALRRGQAAPGGTGAGAADPSFCPPPVSCQVEVSPPDSWRRETHVVYIEPDTFAGTWTAVALSVIAVELLALILFRARRGTVV